MGLGRSALLNNRQISIAEDRGWFPLSFSQEGRRGAGARPRIAPSDRWLSSKSTASALVAWRTAIRAPLLLPPGGEPPPCAPIPWLAPDALPSRAAPGPLSSPSAQLALVLLPLTTSATPARLIKQKCRSPGGGVPFRQGRPMHTQNLVPVLTAAR